MSHFTVAVITDARPSQDELAAVLQPWHEYECTGVDDEYVVDVDDTDRLRADHQKYEVEDAAKDGREPVNFDDWAPGWTSAEKRDDGRWYRRTNPNAKWDWWVVGGRWPNLLRLKAGGASNQARIGDIDLASPAYSDEPLLTFALVKDGRWYERGRMGWWGCVSDEKPEGEWEREFDALLASSPEAWLTIVDCHI